MNVLQPAIIHFVDDQDRINASVTIVRPFHKFREFASFYEA